MAINSRDRHNPGSSFGSDKQPLSYPFSVPSNQFALRFNPSSIQFLPLPFTHLSTDLVGEDGEECHNGAAKEEHEKEVRSPPTKRVLLQHSTIAIREDHVEEKIET